MCLQMTSVRPYQKWHWAGDEIVHDAVIPAARRIPGFAKRGYPIDIRGYLSMESNAVLRRAVTEMADGLSVENARLFRARGEGSFDFRARIVQGFVSERVRYRRSRRSFDSWLFPEETLACGGGDCEDIAFLLAALLEESGISRTCIRVALGRLIDHGTKGEGGYHAWTMYQREDGGWEILEPAGMNLSGSAARAARLSRHRTARSASTPKPALKSDIEYQPHFVFNRDHLWRVRSSDRAAQLTLEDYLGFRIDKFWKKFDPSFAVKAHEHIFDQALSNILPPEEIGLVKHHSFMVDINTLAYDPRDHFDFAYIDEGWRHVRSRLASGRLRDFALAAHAIGDFYAHSFYAHCVPTAGDGRLPLYDPSHPPDPQRFAYDFSNLPRPGCSKSAAEAATLWRGRLISGQWWRWYTTYPDELESETELAPRRCLPDHDAVAVDSRTAADSMKLYATVREYKRQYDLRVDAAIRHVRQEAQEWVTRR
jgi:hypothetical protein